MDRTLCCSEGGTARPVVDTLECMVPVNLDSSEAQGVFPGICGYPPECQKPFSECLLQGGSGLTPPLTETLGDFYGARVGTGWGRGGAGVGRTCLDTCFFFFL